MAISKSTKKRVVTSFSNLSTELQEQVKEHYPLGFTEAMIRIEKPNGDFFYAVPYATDEIDYLVKITVKVDSKNAEEEDKNFYGDEIKDEDVMPEGGESGEEDDDM